MLSIKKIANASVAGSYFSSADYYAKGEDKDAIKSGWFGLGAEKLGLIGEVDIEQFKALLEGHVEDQVVGRISKGGEIQHGAGWDFTLSAPKSVSILALAGGDSRLIEAHNYAVKVAMEHLQEKVETRRSFEGRIYKDNTKRMLAAQFTHTTSRALDPQLHTHNVIQNLTVDDEGKWRSIESENLYEDKKLTGLIYRSELALQVKELGYNVDIDHKKGFFEIKDLPSKVVDNFSKRRKSIKAVAEKEGVTDAVGMADIAIKSRDSKKTSHTNDLVEFWDNELKEMNVDLSTIIDKSIKAKEVNHNPQPKPIKAIDLPERGKPNKTPKPNNEKQQFYKADLNKVSPLTNTTAIEEVRLAYRNLSERQAAFSHKKLLTSSLEWSLSAFSSNDIKAAIKELINKKEIYRGHIAENLLTTPEAYEKETKILTLLDAHKNSVKKIASKHSVKQTIQKMEANLTKGQRDSVELMATSKDRFIGVVGLAGTGKTFALDTAKKVIDKAGYSVVGIAPTNSAAQTMEKEIGADSVTLASFIYQNMGKPKDRSKEILFVDEMSLTNTNDALDLMKIAEKTSARIVFLGDTKQLGAVEAGKPFELLVNNGMKHSIMDEIQRQKNPELLSAVKAAIGIDPFTAFQKLKDNVIELPSREERHAALVRDYMNQDKKSRESSLVIIPDNETRLLTSLSVREELKNKGEINDGQSSEVFVLNNEGLTQVEKSESRFYQKGHIVEFGKDYKTIGTGVKQGSRFVVNDINIKTGEVSLLELNAKGDGADLKSTPIVWKPNEVAGAAKFGVEVYTLEQREISQGDRIVWNRTNKPEKLKNGDKATVLGVDDHKVKVDFGNGDIRTLDTREMKNFDYAYATTVFTAQGMTFDKAFILAESWRKNLVNQKSFYVSLSRARYNAKLYTDDKLKLGAGIIERSGSKTSAREILTKLDGRVDRPEKTPEERSKLQEKVIKLMLASKKALDKVKNATKEKAPDKPQVKERSKSQHHDLEL